MLPLLYRSTGDTAWRGGQTENISRSGVLFRGEQPLELLASVEMSLVLPARTSGECLAHVLCHGQVVRVALPQTPETRAVLAATIVDYRFAGGPERVEG